MSAAQLDRALRAEDTTVRAYACRALGELGSPEQLGPLARISLEDPDSGVRAEAVTALGRLRAPAAVLRDIAVRLLSHESAEVRARAGWAIGKLGADGLPAVAALADRLRNDPAIDGRFGAAWAFGRLRSADGALEPLTAALDDPEPDLRAQAANALGRIGTAPAAGRARLLALLEDDDPLVREEAALALSRIAPGDAEVEAALARLPAATADPGAAEALVDRLGRGSAFERAETPWLLAKAMPRTDARATGRLIELALTDPDSDARWSAIRTLGRAAPESAELTRSLACALAVDRDPDVRAAAAIALAGRWRGDERAARVALAAAARDPDAMVREDAREALDALPPPAAG